MKKILIITFILSILIFSACDILDPVTDECINLKGDCEYWNCKTDNVITWNEGTFYQTRYRNCLLNSTINN